ncbi:phosphoribosyltransferase [Thiococcus pfennigii]|uniref:phosphoribosyltransferase n=1 Tax=Thiococcus pfennigii TaxID=1057 RepID=UPI0019033AC8|nr:phosphoribosyltransferase [Thiococcus pfennigii]MBK1732830.1 phosphoribosyltransferase [Thiococcus pfennigii]
MKLPLENRTEAGRALAELLSREPTGDVVVLALPRGGVPVGWEIAKALNDPLDILLVRKLGVPGQPELAAGAIASGGIRVLNQDLIDALGITQAQLERTAAHEQAELERRERVYRGDRPRPPVTGRRIILVDDGVATGATIRAGIAALRQQHPESIVLAVPVAPPDTLARLEAEADQVVCLATPTPFRAIGQWYQDFHQVTDEEVTELLESSRREDRP